MKNHKELIEEAEKEKLHWKANIIRCFKEYIDAEKDYRSNPISWSSAIMPHSGSPHWARYSQQSNRYKKATADLWMATDVEYDVDGFRDSVWEWRYWSVMSRKCCWYQQFPEKDHLAAETMKKLHNAELNLAAVCGLSDEYKSPCEYIEEAFPNLKKK